MQNTPHLQVNDWEPKIWLIHDPACSCEELQDIKDNLERLNCRLFAAPFDGKTLPALPARQLLSIVFYFPRDVPVTLPTLAEKMRAKLSSVMPALIAVLPKESEDGDVKRFDSILRMPAHPSQLATRLSSLLRLQTMTQELMLRKRTMAAHFDVPFQTEIAHLPQLRILFVGKPAPQFMAVLHALDETEANLTAAFTSFTAFDFLHSEMFDAVVVSGLNGEEPAHTIASTMRRNSRLFNVPALLLMPNADSAISPSARERGITDIIAADAPLNEISGRVLELARGQRAHEYIRQSFATLKTKGARHGQSGIFTEKAFNAHLERVTIDSARRNRPISVGVMHMSTHPEDGPITPEAFITAKIEVESMIESVIRIQDFAARLSSNRVGIIFPDTLNDDVEIIMTRLSELIKATIFVDGEKQFRMELRPSSVTEFDDNIQAVSA